MVVLDFKGGNIFFKTKDESIKIIHDNFLTTNLIEEGSIDLIVTSPPYNVDIHYNSFQDDIPYEKYLEFTEKWLRKAYSLMKPDGRVCLNIPLDKSKGSTMRRTGQKICCAGYTLLLSHF